MPHPYLRKYETFSYLPALKDNEISRQVEYITRNGWVPCLEFADTEQAYVANDSNVRFGPVSSNYYDNRYWTLWKLPMFGCNDPGQVLAEINNCRKVWQRNECTPVANTCPLSPGLPQGLLSPGSIRPRAPGADCVVRGQPP